MYTFLMLAALSMPRINVEVDGNECMIKHILYDDVSTYVRLIGNCEEVYKRCNPRNCIIEKAPSKELNFGSNKPIG